MDLAPGPQDLMTYGIGFTILYWLVVDLPL